MPKLPVCPHCHTIYRYGEVLQMFYGKKAVCYNCKKEFKIKKSRCVLPAALSLALALVINFFEITAMAGSGALTLLITDMIILITAFLLFPYFTIFKKYK